MSNKQLLVIADDFSGACEMAGIAHRYGLNVEIQLDFNPDTHRPVIVFDSDTRRLTADQAAGQLHRFAELAVNSGKDFALFKKIDSVFRGHIIREAEVLHHRFQKKQTFILPANPSKKRLIIEGLYFINETPLDRTDFRKDPDFPRFSGRIPDLLDKQGQSRHLSATDIPDRIGLFTADIPTLAVLDQWIVPGEERLYCGGADAFECFLRKWIPTGSKPPEHSGALELAADFFLFVNGSTHRDVNERLLSGWPQVIHQVLPAAFILKNNPLIDQAFLSWLGTLGEIWSRERGLFLSTPPDIMTEPPAPERMVSLLARAVEALLRQRQGKRIHVLVTGGATASAIVQSSKMKKLEVEWELAPGVVTVSDGEGLFLTAKPGSYPWPDFVFRTNE